MAKENMTQEEKLALAEQKKAERAQEWARLKSNLRANLPAILEALESLSDDVKQDLAKLIGSERTATPKAPKERKLVLREIVAQRFAGVGSVVTGMDLFMDYNLGRAEMNRIVVELIKKQMPDERYWIVSQPNEERPHLLDYKLVAIGAAVPEGWDGYIPTDADAYESTVGENATVEDGDEGTDEVVDMEANY